MDEQGPDQIELSSRPRRSRIRPMAVAGVAVVAVVAGAGVAVATTSHPAPTATTTSALSTGATPSASASPSAAKHHGRHGHGGGSGLGIGLGSVLHGQVTIRKAGGGYETVDVQRGTVTAVGSSSLTVKSADGYSATYAVSSSTNVNAEAAGIGSVKSGDTVLVEASTSGSTATAVHVRDATAIKNGRAKITS
jgi:hypothetical protein